MYPTQRPTLSPPAAILSGLLILATFIGCGGDPAQNGPTETDAVAAPKWTIGFSQSNQGDAYRSLIADDLFAAAAEHPDMLLVVRDAGGDASAQASQLREMIGLGVDLIIVCPEDPMAVTPVVGQAMDADIPVVVLDRPVIGRQYTTLIAPDDEQLGEAVGHWLVEKLDGKGNLIELEGTVDSAESIARKKGFRRAIRDADFDVMLSTVTDWKAQDAAEAMESALAQFDSIDAVFGHDDVIAHAAYLEAKDAGRADSILFVGIGGLPEEGLKWVREGTLDATLAQTSGGRLAVAIALQVLRGESVPQRITPTTRVYTPKNVASGGEEIEKGEGTEKSEGAEKGQG